MSDTVTSHGPFVEEDQARERRRSLVSLAAALGVHVALLAAFAVALGASSAPPTLPPVTIELQSASGAESEPAPGPEAAAGAPGAASAASSTPVSGPAVTTGNSFVIPTPRLESDTQSSAAGPAFREAGGRTGVVQGISSSPSAQPGPAVAPVRQGSGSGTAAASGSGSASVQRSGTAVTVGGSTASGGSLDLSKLDKGLAGGSAARGGTGGSSAGAGAGGTSGSNGSGAGSGAGTAAGGADNYPVQWGSPAGEGRRLVFVASPRLPAWVSRQGLALSVTVSFSVLADGVVQGVAVQQSSGFADVDAAVIDAIRMCLFNAAPNTPPVKGVIPYVIRAR